MPGHVSDRFDPEWGTAENVERIRDALQGMYDRVSCVLAGAGVVEPLEVLAMPPRPAWTCTAVLSEREWRIIRFDNAAATVRVVDHYPHNIATRVYYLRLCAAHAREALEHRGAEAMSHRHYNDGSGGSHAGNTYNNGLSTYGPASRPQRRAEEAPAVFVVHTSQHEVIGAFEEQETLQRHMLDAGWEMLPHVIPPLQPEPLWYRPILTYLGRPIPGEQVYAYETKTPLVSALPEKRETCRDTDADEAQR